MKMCQMEFTSAIGSYERKYTMFFDSEVMTEQEALNEAHYAEGGCHNPEFIGHYIIVPEAKMPFFVTLVKAEKEKAREEGFEAGQNNLLEAGYHL